MRKEEFNFWMKNEWGDFVITLRYLVKEPYFEIKRLVSGYYNSALVFWFAVYLFFLVWRRTGNPLKIMGVIVLLAYIYMFHRSGKAKEYYKKEMIEGKEIV